MYLQNLNEAPLLPGGLGVGISDYYLARILAALCGVGVVSSTVIDVVAARRLQDGDLGGVYRQALEHFPIPEMGRRVWDRYYLRRGRGFKQPYALTPMILHQPSPQAIDLLIVANFVEVWLAKQGHEGIIGINLLTKLETRDLLSLFGAILAGVDFVIAGAGFPTHFPEALERLSSFEEASSTLHLVGGDPVPMRFDPASVMDKSAFKPLKIQTPLSLGVVSSTTAAKHLLKCDSRFYGFVFEGPTAGGHNAPPRGGLNETGEAIYGDRDIPDLEAILELGKPFWFAGGWGSREGLKAALEMGASGVQVGTPFALCDESGMLSQIKRQVIQMIRSRTLEVITDSRASSSGLPFKVAIVPETVGEESVYEDRPRVCDLGCLRQPYQKEGGGIGYRCPAEPIKDFVNKGGDPKEAERRKCLCNGLLATAGYAQIRKDGTPEPAIVTLGNDLLIPEKAKLNKKGGYGAKYVVDRILGS